MNYILKQRMYITEVLVCLDSKYIAFPKSIILDYFFDTLVCSTSGSYDNNQVPT